MEVGDTSLAFSISVDFTVDDIDVTLRQILCLMIPANTQRTSLINMSLTMFQILVALKPEGRNMVSWVTGLALSVSV
jgi:hypothetical protein